MLVLATSMTLKFVNLDQWYYLSFIKISLSFDIPEVTSDISTEKATELSTGMIFLAYTETKISIQLFS